MSQVRKMRREQERGRREEWRDRRRQLARRAADHICEPVFRGAGHMYAYCKYCGRVMTHVAQPPAAVKVAQMVAPNTAATATLDAQSTAATEPAAMFAEKSEEVEHAI